MINIYNRDDRRLCEKIDSDLNNAMHGTLSSAEVYMDDYIRINCDNKISRLFHCLKDSSIENNNPVSSNTTKHICNVGTDTLLLSYGDGDYWRQKRIQMYERGQLPKSIYPDW